MSEAPLVRVRGLARHFDVSQPFLTRVLKGRGLRSLKAVDGVDLEIRRGETFSLVGESGCGKSTMARLAVGLLRPTAGTVEFEGVDVSRLRTRA